MTGDGAASLLTRGATLHCVAMVRPTQLPSLTMATPMMSAAHKRRSVTLQSAIAVNQKD